MLSNKLNLRLLTCLACALAFPVVAPGGQTLRLPVIRDNSIVLYPGDHYLDLAGKVTKRYAGDAGTASYEKLSPRAFYSLREAAAREIAP